MADTAHFGSRQVPLEAKQAMVDDVFHSVARRYDLMNDLMSLGLHRAWKDALVTAVNPPKDRAFFLLDLAGGTGDVAFRVLKHGGAATRATVCDINAGMLEVGRERAAALALGEAIAFAEANAEALPFADRSFDAVTIAFGIRNVPRIDRALAEAFRVLKIGGRFVCLNFPASMFRASTGCTISIRSMSFPHSAAWSRATPNPTAISSNRFAASPTGKLLPPCCARRVLPGFRSIR